MVDRAEIHRMAFSENVEERKKIVEYFSESFRYIPDEEQEQAWANLIRLTKDENKDVQRDAMFAVSDAFHWVDDKEQAWADLHQLARHENSIARSSVAYALGQAFVSVNEIKSNVSEEKYIGLPELYEGYYEKSYSRLFEIGQKFAKWAWEDLHRLAQDETSHVRAHAAYSLGAAFSYIPDKDRAWADLHKLTQDTDKDVRKNAAYVLNFIFSLVPDINQAWDDLVRLRQDMDSIVRANARFALPSNAGLVFFNIRDKKQAWSDLHRLVQDEDHSVRVYIAYSLGAAFPHISDKEQAWDDLIHLAHDESEYVRSYAYHSLGRVSISKAIEAKDEENFKKELENALNFFEKSSKEHAYFSPASFCLPFYRSLYTITFENQEVETEVQKYLAEAKNAVHGSESRQKLLEAVENLANALKVVHKAREMGLEAMKIDLDAHRRYLDRAADLLETTGEKAPGATNLIKKGLPIIDERIQGIIEEIQEKAKALYKQTKDTPFEELGKEINRIGKKFSQIRNPIGLEKTVNNLQIVLTSICSKMPDEEKGEACELLRKAMEEQYVEDKINLFNMVLSKISTQIYIAQRLLTDFERLRSLIEEHYKKEDKNELIETVKQMEQSSKDPSKKDWLKEKLGRLLTRTSEVSSISSLIITLLQQLR